MQATLKEHTPGPAGNSVNVDGCPDCDTEPQWVVIGQTYGAGRQQIEVFNRWAMTLDERGKYLRHLAQPVPWALLAMKWRCSLAEAQARFLRMGAAQRLALQEAMRDEFEQAFLFCMALMHCGNVEEVEVQRSAPIVHKRRERSRAQIPEIRYNTLTVTPPRTAQQRVPAAGEEGANGAGEAEPKALHSCAGTSRTTASMGSLASTRACTGGTARCAGGEGRRGGYGLSGEEGVEECAIKLCNYGLVPRPFKQRRRPGETVWKVAARQCAQGV